MFYFNMSIIGSIRVCVAAMGRFHKLFPAIVIISFAFLPACSSVTKEKSEGSIAGDYLFQSNGDTIQMELGQQQDSVFGDLKYAFSGKDKNIGKIRGILQDSMITAEYHFVSEGIPSIRQIVFKLTDQGLVEGYGEIEDSHGKMVFSDMNNLSFDHGMVLHKK